MGVRLSSNWHLYELMEKYPTASLTILRDGEPLVTESIENWKISGVYEAG